MSCIKKKKTYDVAMAQAVFNKKKTLVTSNLNRKSRKKLTKCYKWNVAVYGAEWRFIRCIRNALKVVQRGAQEGRKRSFGLVALDHPVW